MIAQLAAIIFLLIICGLGPGMLLTRRFRLAPLERLCTAVGISWIVIYLFVTLIYLTGISWNWCYAGSTICAILCALTWRDTRDLFHSHLLRRTVGGFALLSVWMIVLLGLVRTYSGGTWAGDWLEHYERAQFFLNHWPKDYSFIGLYILPARPPMMNLLTAFFMAQVGKGFAPYEFVTAILNLSTFLVAALMLNQLAWRGRRGLALLVLALISSPFFAQNVTYTMTKLFCVFYVLLGISLYVRGHRQGDHPRRILAFFMMAAGVLVHYSAGPFTVFLTGHYLLNFIKKWRNRWREMLVIFFSCSALLASWFTWSIIWYGLNGTVDSTTTVSDSSKLSALSNFLKVLWNIYYTLIPAPIGRMNYVAHYQSTIGFVRDIAFYCYQQNLLLMMGSAGAVVAIWIFWRTIFMPRRTQPPLNVRGHSSRRWFWVALVIFCVPAAIATHGAPGPTGLAHVVLQPLVLLGIAAIAANAMKLPRWGLALLMLGWAVDFCLGVLLQMYLENMTFVAQAGGHGVTRWYMSQSLAAVVEYNFAAAQSRGLRFIGDYCANCSAVLLVILIAGELIFLWWSWNRYNNRKRLTAN